MQLTYDLFRGSGRAFSGAFLLGSHTVPVGSLQASQSEDVKAADPQTQLASESLCPARPPLLPQLAQAWERRRRRHAGTHAEKFIADDAHEAASAVESCDSRLSVKWKDLDLAKWCKEMELELATTDEPSSDSYEGLSSDISATLPSETDAGCACETLLELQESLTSHLRLAQHASKFCRFESRHPGIPYAGERRHVASAQKGSSESHALVGDEHAKPHRLSL
eukprot:gnl/TRDRNA2_/TRDRNA2_212835_c0_seq1.p1 gnl/TRDRNA2_/TRDRNA2_212835_c0~~gnl/TRDRNA2_/TRDRNA2_212835_c0_seq1.p1  ORF type:complete len:223 (+),score=39.17 gnl/TRDRNA2_/TRDRNA2_212835_c0_seq1:89-757(+)